ncbi:MAG TPA: hypothetical protein VMT20_07395 [Terriglobia bacterium]|nr:hypothetical protein [Terriglobia bacterium]
MNIVLVHGMPGFAAKFGIEYFNGVKHQLEKFPANVFVANLSFIGSIADRGEELRTQVSTALSSGALNPDEKTHIIAHSQGGLDARYMLSTPNVPPKIVSLTTIATPHQGSPIAELLDGPILLSALDVLGIDRAALEDLTGRQMKKFNDTYADNPKVDYFFAAGKGRGGQFATSFPLLPLHRYIESLNGEANDGLVTVSSARHGKAISDPWLADHADEIGHDLDKPFDPKAVPPFDYLRAYEDIVKRVSSL